MSSLWVGSLIVAVASAIPVLCMTALCWYVVAKSGGKTEGLRDVAVVVRALARVRFHRPSSKDE